MYVKDHCLGTEEKASLKTWVILLGFGGTNQRSILQQVMLGTQEYYTSSKILGFMRETCIHNFVFLHIQIDLKGPRSRRDIKKEKSKTFFHGHPVGAKV